MPGYFKKAPLVYVTAQFSCSRFPELNSSEQESLHKAMVNIGLPDRQTSEVSQVALNVSQASFQTEHSRILRQGFFSADKHRCFVITPASIEYRVSDYFKFGEFCRQLSGVLEALFQAVPAYKKSALKETILNYSDTIVPKQGRKLSDYFKEASILPLSFLSEYEGDLQQAGQTQATRIVKPDLRIAVSLEQLPVQNQQIQRWLPQQMVEPDQVLSMPLKIHPEFAQPNSRFYGILLTQGGKLINKTFTETSISNALNEIHEEIKHTFNGLLNHDVCNLD